VAVTFSFESDAAAFIKEQHGSAVALRTSPRHGCCGGTVWLPIIEPGVPEKQDGWQKFDVNGIEIYCEPGLDLPQETSLKIGLDKLLFWQKLWIEGIDTQPNK
jgi:hypothetical protein